MPIQRDSEIWVAELSRRSASLYGPRRGDHFRLAHPLAWVLIPALWGLNFAAWANPQLVADLWVLGPIGAAALHFARNYNQLCYAISVLGFIFGLLEAWVAFILCVPRRIGMGAQFKWTGQTFVLGLFSLIPLLQYRPPKPAKKTD